MTEDPKRGGLWNRLSRGLFEFDAPLTANLLPLLPDPATKGRRVLRGSQRSLPTAPAPAPAEEHDIDVSEAAVVGERSALVVVHGQALGERFDLAPGTVVLGGPDDPLRISDETPPRPHATLTCDPRGVTIRDDGTPSGVHVDFRRVREARLEHGALIWVGRTLLKYLHCDDVAGAHFDIVHHLGRHDGLTDVHHERHVRHVLRRELSHARRHLGALALVVLDPAPRAALDDRVRDLLLRDVARAARPAAGDDGVLGRLGPGLLALVLPGLDSAAATPRAEALRAAVAGAAFTVCHGHGAGPPVIGLAAATRRPLAHDELPHA
jgi:GGDEF domain-containing protein